MNASITAINLNPRNVTAVRDRILDYLDPSGTGECVVRVDQGETQVQVVASVEVDPEHMARWNRWWMSKTRIKRAADGSLVIRVRGDQGISRVQLNAAELA